MLITISAKHMELTEAISAYIRRKVAKLPKFFNRVQQLAVTVERDRVGYHVEIRSDVERHRDFVCNSRLGNLYACVDLAVDRGVRQLKDHKDRIRHHRP